MDITWAIMLSTVACASATEPPIGVVYAGRRLHVGETHVCALDSGGAVYCWGQNGAEWEYGQAPAAQASSSVPITVPVPTLASLSGGVAQHTCGITPSGAGVCWGRGEFGQLGGGTLGITGNRPAAIKSDVSWLDIVVSRLSTCGIASDHTPYCWGTNQRGEIGVDTIPIDHATDVPVATASTFPFVSIAPGWLHACGIVVGGQVFCWGDNSNGQLGVGAADTIHHRVAAPIAGSDLYVQLSSGSLYTCGITVDHRAMCWGANDAGQLGDGTKTTRTSPTQVGDGSQRFQFIAVSSGFAGGTNAVRPSTHLDNAHVCALTDAGAAYCWGWNGAGQLGDSSTTDRLTPVPVAHGLQFTTLALGGSHTCGMRGSEIWCWGSNSFGQLGNGTNVDSPVPVVVQSPFNRP